MSLVDRNIIDYLYFEENKIILGISDHLPWSADAIAAHWEILQDKLKDYITFIYSGQLKEKYPDNDKTPCIKIFFSEPWDKVVEKYLNKLRDYYNELGNELIWVYDPVKIEE